MTSRTLLTVENQKPLKLNKNPNL